MTFDTISQICIALLGGAAIWFLSRREEWKRWGHIIGLCSQPFWFYTTVHHRQWGLFVLSLWYTYSWCQGIWNYWLKERKRDVADP